jgi:hypothetical protein
MASFKFYFSITAFIIALLLTGCSAVTKDVSTAEDTTYLTPIPDATISAYREGSSIDNKLQAVIAARQELNTPHFQPVGAQKVLFVKELRLADAYKLVENPGSYTYPDWVEDSKVWFVVFEGDIQVTGPGEHTPDPPFHGCSYVIIRAKSDQGGGVVGGIDCSTAVELQ